MENGKKTLVTKSDFPRLTRKLKHRNAPKYAATMSGVTPPLSISGRSDLGREHKTPS
jgi:hypothetical protein